MGKSINWEHYKNEIEDLSTLEFNYDDKLYHDSKDKIGWFIDEYSALVGEEAPGKPLAKGPFQRLKIFMELYRFPSPQLIYAVFNPHQPLLGRNMYMFAHFGFLRFNFGVRVTSVIDEIKNDNLLGPITHWGYSYRTLKGHFEIGEIRFELQKHHKTGQIFFKVNAYSKPERISQPFYRLGFKFFGRMLQKYFVNSSIERLRKEAQSKN